MKAVGLDVGTGFTKVSALGRTAMFPSLYACKYSNQKGIENAGSEKKIMLEEVGENASEIGRSRDGILIRPVKYGVPYNDRGFAMLAKEALAKVGIKEYSDVSIAVGVTFDARESRSKIQKIVNSKIRPARCVVIPQAFGTMLSCDKKFGTVINIGHGTTEIIHIDYGGIDGISIPKASEFVISQLAKKSRRDSYVNYKELFQTDIKMTERLVRMLAEHIADEVVRMNVTGEIILAGGGSQMPHMKEALEKILGRELTVPEDPVFSNARGLEKIAASGSTGGNDVEQKAKPSAVEEPKEVKTGAEKTSP